MRGVDAGRAWQRLQGFGSGVISAQSSWPVENRTPFGRGQCRGRRDGTPARASRARSQVGPGTLPEPSSSVSGAYIGGNPPIVLRRPCHKVARIDQFSGILLVPRASRAQRGCGLGGGQGMYVVPVAWIRHVADELGRDSPVVTGALRAAGLAPGVLAGDVRAVRAQAFRRLHRGGGAAGARRPLRADASGRATTCAPRGSPPMSSITAANLREAMRERLPLRRADRHQRRLRADRGGRRGALPHGQPLPAGARQPPGDRVQGRLRRRLLPALGGRAASARSRCASPTRGRARGARWRRFFGCPARFARETTEMLLSADQLALPVSAPIPTSSRSWSTMPRRCWPAGSRRATGCASGWRGW